MTVFEIVIFAVTVMISAAAVYAKVNTRQLYSVIKPVPLFILAMLMMHECRMPSADAALAMLIAAGLICGFAGDICLLKPGRLFALGILAFLIGHLFYFYAFMSRSAEVNLFSIMAVIPALVFIFVFQKRLQGEKRNIIPMLVPYFGIIILMCFGAFNYDLSAHRFPVYGLAALMFCASDALLVWGSFVHNSKIIQVLVLSLYYPAQIIIALYTVILIK